MLVRTWMNQNSWHYWWLCKAVQQLWKSAWQLLIKFSILIYSVTQQDPGYLYKRNENICSLKDLYKNIHSSFIIKAKKGKTAQTSIRRAVVNPYRGTPLSKEAECIADERNKTLGWAKEATPSPQKAYGVMPFIWTSGQVNLTHCGRALSSHGLRAGALPRTVWRGQRQLPGRGQCALPWGILWGEPPQISGLLFLSPLLSFTPTYRLHLPLSSVGRPWALSCGLALSPGSKLGLTWYVSHLRDQCPLGPDVQCPAVAQILCFFSFLFSSLKVNLALWLSLPRSQCPGLDICLFKENTLSHPLRCEAGILCSLLWFQRVHPGALGMGWALWHLGTRAHSFSFFLFPSIANVKAHALPERVFSEGSFETPDSWYFL